MNLQKLVLLQESSFKDHSHPLRRVSQAVTVFDHSLMELVKEMVAFMDSSEICIALAAPQIGIWKRVAVVDRSDSDQGPLILVNPVIVSSTGKKDVKRESCMSIPHYRGPVVRRHKIQVRFKDETGIEKELVVEGFQARVICHEVDHLDGIVYLDRMNDLAELERVEFFKAAGYSS